MKISLPLNLQLLSAKYTYCMRDRICSKVSFPHILHASKQDYVTRDSLTCFLCHNAARYFSYMHGRFQAVICNDTKGMKHQHFLKWSNFVCEKGSFLQIQSHKLYSR